MSAAVITIGIEPGDLVAPAAWLGTRGFSIYGAVIGGGLAAVLYVRRTGPTARHVDAAAFGLPAGLAVGRLGDEEEREHHLVEPPGW